MLSRTTKTFGVPGFDLEFHQRVAMLVEMVGGLGRAAEVVGKDTETVNRWRKKGARVPIEGLLPLAVAGRVTLDWVATGHQQRPDILALGWAQSGLGLAEDKPPFNALDGFVRLAPVQPELQRAAGRRIERYEPSAIAVAKAWLQHDLGLRPDDARYAVLQDDGMAPLMAEGAFVVVDIRPAQPRRGIYLVELGDEFVARRLAMMPDGRMELTAAEPNWRFTIDPARPLPRLHRIVWEGQKL